MNVEYIQATKPDLLMLLGDNVYSDAGDTGNATLLLLPTAISTGV